MRFFLSPCDDIGEVLLKVKHSGEPCEVVFSPGVFCLHTEVMHSSPSIAHDEGCGRVEEKRVHLLLKDIDNLSLCGSVDEQNRIVTILVASNTDEKQSLLPTLLWAEGCGHLQLKNLILRRSPSAVLSATVSSVEDDAVFLDAMNKDGKEGELFPLYCMNALDADGRLRTTSLTYGFGSVPSMKWIGKGRAVVQDASLASQLKEGQLISAHQGGRTDFFLFFGRCDDLKLENIIIDSANGMAILTEQCCTIEANYLTIAPQKGSYFTTSRDGWKLYRCSGSITLDQCHIEGTRMDGQNIHSNFLTVSDVLDSHTLLCSCKYAPLALKEGSLVSFGSQSPYFERTLKDWELVSSSFVSPTQEKSEGSAPIVGRENRINVYRLRFKERVSAFCCVGMLARALCWEVDSYRCRNSMFSNIAGAAIMLRCSNAIVEGNTFMNCMNAGILIGSELATHQECSHANNVLVQNNLFVGNGFKSRYGRFGIGGVSIHSQGFTTACNEAITLRENSFYDAQLALQISCARDVLIEGNRYKNISKRLSCDSASTHELIDKEFGV